MNIARTEGADAAGPQNVTRLLYWVPLH